MFLTVQACSSGAIFRSMVERMLKVRQFYSLKLKCSTAQGWTKVQVYIWPCENIEEGRERTGIVNLFRAEKSLQTRSVSAVRVSNKIKKNTSNRTMIRKALQEVRLGNFLS